MLLVCGDLNGHVGKTSSGFEGLHGGHGYGVRNPEGTRILELCVAADLVITNTFFTKCDSQLSTLLMRAHKSITFWFEKVTSNQCVMLKSLVAKNASHSISCLLENLS